VWGYGGPEQDDSKFPTGPVESIGCIGLGPGEFVPRVIIPLQSPNQSFKMPKGVALRLEPGQQIWLNPHLKNNSGKAVVPKIRANFYAAKPGTVKHIAEGMIAGNMGDINIPAASAEGPGTQTLTAEWTAPLNLNIVFLQTHQHQLGTYGNIELVENGTPRKIYENFRWEHPRSYWPREPLRLAKGDKMRITCTWENPNSVPVHFGENTTDEMCFILGFFYRDDGDTQQPALGQCLPSKSGLLCPLAPKVN
jgi:Copper type II ascorbate-dependent monooxygenase, C-terminal domain